MKKTINLIAVGFLIFTLLIPTVAVASIETEPEWQDIVLSEIEFEQILSNNPNNEIITFSSGLIDHYSIAISKNGSTLIIVGKTVGNSSVVKCGFTKVTIQRRSNSSSSWSDYKSYKDLYNESKTYNLSKNISVPAGYQYRVICTHYAKKNIFSTQKIDNTSNTIKF